MRLDADFRVFSFPPVNHNIEARKVWIKANPDFIRHESFGCLLGPNGIVAFGDIDRNIDQLAEILPMVTLQIANDAAFGRAILAAKSTHKLTFIQIDTPMFSYLPILQCLQSKSEISLANELLSIHLDERNLLSNQHNYCKRLRKSVTAIFKTYWTRRKPYIWMTRSLNP